MVTRRILVYFSFLYSLARHSMSLSTYARILGSVSRQIFMRNHVLTKSSRNTFRFYGNIFTAFVLSSLTVFSGFSFLLRAFAGVLGRFYPYGDAAPDGDGQWGGFWNFIIDGYRSECPEYPEHAQLTPRIQLYSIPTRRYDMWDPSYQTISVKSCTGHTDTPSDGSMDWYDDEIMPLEKLE